MDDLLSLSTGQHQHQQEQHGGDELQHIGGQTGVDGDLDTELIQDAAQQHGGGPLGGGQEAQALHLPQALGGLGAGEEADERDADDDRRQAKDHLADAHDGGVAPLLLAQDAAAQGDERVGDHHAQDLHVALVLGQGGDQGPVVTHGPQEQAGLGAEVEVQQKLHHNGQDQGNDELSPAQGQIAEQGHDALGGKDGVHRPLHGHVGPGDEQVDGREGRHGDDTGQQVPHAQAHVDEAGAQPGDGPRRRRAEQRRPGVHTLQKKDGRHRRAQGEAAVHGQVRKVQHRIGDVHPVGQQGVDQALGQGRNDQV